MGALSLRWRLSTGLQAYAMGCPIHNLQAGSTSVSTVKVRCSRPFISDTLADSTPTRVGIRFFFAIRMRPPHALLPPPFHLHTHTHRAAPSSTLHSFCIPIHAKLLTVIFAHGLPHAAGAARLNILVLLTELRPSRCGSPDSGRSHGRVCAVHHWRSHPHLHGGLEFRFVVWFTVVEELL